MFSLVSRKFLAMRNITLYSVCKLYAKAKKKKKNKIDEFGCLTLLYWLLKRWQKFVDPVGEMIQIWLGKKWPNCLISSTLLDDEIRK